MDEALIQEQERQLQKTGRYYQHVFWLCVPLLCMACYYDKPGRCLRAHRTI